jgi:CHAD domain-containing protein
MSEYIFKSYNKYSGVLIMKKNKLQKTSLLLLSKARELAISLEREGKPKYLHKFRVNLRKLRSILKDFKPYLKKSSYIGLCTKLKFLLTSSNKLRDDDVFLKYLEEYKQSIPKNLEEEFILLYNKIKEEREFEYKNILEFITSEEFINHFDSIKETLKKHKTYKNNIWKNFRKTKTKIQKKIQKKVKYKRETLSQNADSEIFHELRILYKRLRYLNELFIKDSKSNIDEFKEIQSTLGTIQDLSIQQKILEQYLTRDEPLGEFLFNMLKTKQDNYKMTFRMVAW